MKKILNNKKGFTLMELIVVMAIIAILAAIAIPSFVKVMDNAQKADTVSKARNVFSLAQIELLDDQIAGVAPSHADADFKDAIALDAGCTADEITTITPAHDYEATAPQADDYRVKSVTVTANGWIVTVTNDVTTEADGTLSGDGYKVESKKVGS